MPGRGTRKGIVPRFAQPETPSLVLHEFIRFLAFPLHARLPGELCTRSFITDMFLCARMSRSRVHHDTRFTVRGHAAGNRYFAHFQLTSLSTSRLRSSVISSAGRTTP